MTYPTITALPAAPDPNDPGTFNARAAAWVAALGGFTTQVNNAGAYLQQLAVLGTGGTWQVVQSPTDSTGARLVTTGWMGVGGVPILYSSTAPFNVPLVDATHFIGNQFNSNTPADAPVGSAAFAGIHLRLTSTRQVQVLFQAAGDRSAYWRANDSGWSQWRRFVDNFNLLGTVSQSGGNPTGAVIERGANANGEYVRFADGTQLCWRTLTGSTGAASTWTFPAAFVAAPVVTGTAVATALSAVCLDAAPGATAATVSARDGAGARRADVMHLIACGRWF